MPIRVETSPECVKVVASDGTLLQMNLGKVGDDRGDEVSTWVQSWSAGATPLREYRRDVPRRFNDRMSAAAAGAFEFDIDRTQGHPAGHMEMRRPFHRGNLWQGLAQLA